MNTKKVIQSVENNTQNKGRPRGFCRTEALEKALALFCENGYEATSVAQLGQAMNMSPPSLYNAFGNKENLFIEVLDYYYKPHENIVQKLFSEKCTTEEAIEKLFDLSRSYHMKENSLGCLIVNSAINVCAKDSTISSKIKSLHDNNESVVYGRLKRGQEEGDIPHSADIRGLSRYINGALQGAAALARGQQSSESVNDFLTYSYEGFKKLIR